MPIFMRFTFRSIGGCFTWDIVEKWFRFVVANTYIIFFHFTSTGFITRIIFFIHCTVYLKAKKVFQILFSIANRMDKNVFQNLILSRYEGEGVNGT